jgi:dCTP deaminase
VRLLSDDTTEFDKLTCGHKGPLYIEVTPITFDILVERGTCLSQLRLFRGADRLVNMTHEELGYEPEFPVKFEPGSPTTNDIHEVHHPFRLDLSLDRNGYAGFVAKKEPPEPIDPNLKGPNKKGYYSPEKFWEPVTPSNGAIQLEPDRLYILRSKERLCLPAHIALECQAYTETMGEWRIEYAGFAHPFFGSLRKDGRGSPLMFEVRGHNIPTILTDGIPLGNVCFKRMSKPVEPAPPPSQYENQELMLSGCFADWPAKKS